MGVPFSKEISEILAQVTPTAEQAAESIQTVKYVTFLVLILQIIQSLILTLLLVAIIALIFSVNSGLEKERKALVDPMMRSLAARWMTAKDS